MTAIKKQRSKTYCTAMKYHIENSPEIHTRVLWKALQKKRSISFAARLSIKLGTVFSNVQNRTHDLRCAGEMIKCKVMTQFADQKKTRKAFFTIIFARWKYDTRSVFYWKLMKSVRHAKIDSFMQNKHAREKLIIFKVKYARIKNAIFERTNLFNIRLV